MRMTAYELKYQYESRGNGSYFTRDTMKFFGDTMANYYVPAKTAMVTNYIGEVTECYVLRRRRPARWGMSNPAFFCVKTFNRIHGEVKD